MKPNFNEILDKTYGALRENLKHKARDVTWRKSQLHALKTMLVENDEIISSAMWKDLHKSPFECSATEQGAVIAEIDYMLVHLDGLMRPETVSTPLFNQIGTSSIHHDPYGLVLIIGAWNYPVNLLLTPLVGAISGGNAVLIKPSEMAGNTADLMTKLLRQYMDPDLIAVIECGGAESDILLEKKFDLIFFTGSGRVGKIVLQKAAEHLTPVVLELGGKSPAMVLDDADIKVAARRLTWGKFMNGGQTCVSPDYIMVGPSVKEELIHEIKASLHEFYGENIKANDDYCRIINEKNFDRLMGLMSGSTIIYGGSSEKSSLYIEPTLLESTVESKVMQEEVFGPLWPILEMKDVTEMIDYVKQKPKPLALYLFTQDDYLAEKVLTETSSGGVCVNDVIMHMASPTLPFGGVGESGMGNYHGAFSFDTFTHCKSVLKKSTMVDVPLRYPPYTENKLKWMKRFFV